MKDRALVMLAHANLLESQIHFAFATDNKSCLQFEKLLSSASIETLRLKQSSIRPKQAFYLKIDVVGVLEPGSALGALLFGSRTFGHGCSVG